MIRHSADAERRLLERRGGKVDEARLKGEELARERMISDFTAKATEAYSKILTRYPAMECADDAKARLVALHQTVPRPTKAMLAQNKAEENARKQKSITGAMMGALSRRPDVSAATNVGDPSLQDQEPISASGIVQAANRVAAGAKPSSGTESLSVKTTGTGEPGENQPAPRSDTPPTDPNAALAAIDPASGPAPTKANEVKPSAEPQTDAANDPNELKPNVAQDPAPAQAPAQVNEIQNGDPSEASANGATASQANGQELADDNAIASSKRKKKKGLHKVIPFK